MVPIERLDPKPAGGGLTDAAAPGAFAFLGWRCDRMVASVLGCILAGPPAA